MTARVRKFVGGIAVVIFLIAYACLVVPLADHIPDNQLARLAFFVAAGLLWGVPILPLLTWMNRGR